MRRTHQAKMAAGRPSTTLNCHPSGELSRFRSYDLTDECRVAPSTISHLISCLLSCATKYMSMHLGDLTFESRPYFVVKQTDTDYMARSAVTTLGCGVGINARKALCAVPKHDNPILVFSLRIDKPLRKLYMLSTLDPLSTSTIFRP